MRTTTSIESQTPAEVAGNTPLRTIPTARTLPALAAAPFFGNVGAGLVTPATREEQKPLNITDLIRQVAAVGVTFDRNDTGNYDQDDILTDLTEYLKAGELTDLYSPENISGMMSPGGGAAALSVVRGYFQWRSGRRRFCQQLQGFIAAVEADDARRNREEFVAVDLEERLRLSALLPTRELQKQRGQEVAAGILEQMRAVGETLQADRVDPDSNMLILDVIGDCYVRECSRETTLQPCVQDYEGAAAFAAAIFGPDLVPDPKSPEGHEFETFILAAIYLKAKRSSTGADSLFEAAAIVAQRMMQAPTETEE